MSIRIENDCNGCEVCIGCGRGSYKAFFCDICQNEICDDVFFVDNQHVCEECLPEVIPHCNVEDYFDEEEYFDE